MHDFSLYPEGAIFKRFTLFFIFYWLFPKRIIVNIKIFEKDNILDIFFTFYYEQLLHLYPIKSSSKDLSEKSFFI